MPNSRESNVICNLGFGRATIPCHQELCLAACCYSIEGERSYNYI